MEVIPLMAADRLSHEFHSNSDVEGQMEVSPDSDLFHSQAESYKPNIPKDAKTTTNLSSGTMSKWWKEKNTLKQSQVHVNYIVCDRKAPQGVFRWGSPSHSTLSLKWLAPLCTVLPWSERTCGRRRLRSERWSSHWSIWRCSPRLASGGPRSGSWGGSPRCGRGSSATPGRRSSPHWSTGPCPRPDSAPLRSLWQRGVESDWWSGGDNSTGEGRGSLD